ncbi:winged helix-turn-helix domain-containing protein [Candidatus Pelagibacter sp.]|nr:winged helix-turn-helix domain-containing protein [Candidatus Pelagibacter sp.]
MNNKILIIYKFITLYHILDEIDLDLNFKIIEINDENQLNEEILKSTNYLVISEKTILKKQNQIFIEKLPIKILKLLEKINIEFIKQQFNSQSQVTINKYLLDLNSREMSFNGIKLKLTEKEVNTIIYLSKVKKPVSIKELQQNVWSYQPDIETHTVETHIYRLRRKIFDVLKDENFIVSKKNGYQIK